MLAGMVLGTDEEREDSADSFEPAAGFGASALAHMFLQAVNRSPLEASNDGDLCLSVVSSGGAGLPSTTPEFD